MPGGIKTQLSGDDRESLIEAFLSNDELQKYDSFGDFLTELFSEDAINN